MPERTHDSGQPVRDLAHLVDGRWVTGGGETAVSTDPARPDRQIASYRPADRALLDQAIAAARAAAGDWGRTSPIERGRIVRKAAELLQARAEEVALLMTREEGKTLPESRAEVMASIDTLHYHANSGRNEIGAVFPSGHPDELVRTVRRPIGVVAAITPWNFPLQIPVWKIAPALMCGNAVVWKPASATVAVSAAFAEILVDAGVPAGVLAMLLGPGRLGAELVARAEVGAVTFTGSVPVGNSIRDAVVPRGAKVQMELGGHNAAIVLPDADPATAADAIIAAAMGSTGQKCTATRRIVAVGDVHDELVRELTARVRRLVVGDGTDDGVAVGPMVSTHAAKEVDEAVKNAVAEGAQILAQATVVPPASEGAYVAPTLLAGGPDLSICREEVFGPVTTVLRAADLDEAISLANGTGFGLTASVFTCDERAIRRCLLELDAGLVKVNAPSTGSELHAPFGGIKDSSFPAPREQNAASSSEFFTQTITAYLRPGVPCTRS